jgi:hypothetical protein
MRTVHLRPVRAVKIFNTNELDNTTKPPKGRPVVSETLSRSVHQPLPEGTPLDGLRREPACDHAICEEFSGELV